MQVAIVVPSLRTFTGNSASAKRVLAGLVAQGHEGKIVDFDSFGVYVGAIVSAYEPDIVHAFHARKAGFHVRDQPGLVISLTGTDAGRDLTGPDTRAQVLEACHAAKALIVHHAATAAALTAAAPALESRIRIVPKGFGLSQETPYSLRTELAIPPERPIFLLAGGLRPIKGQLRAIQALDGADVELVLAGPMLDAGYAEELKHVAASRPWVRFIEIKPQSKMPGAYRDADVVINASSEEGASNSIIEAMHAGRAVLASDIPGNRALIRPGSTGVLFRDEAEFRHEAKRLRDDVAARAMLGAAAGLAARAAHDPAAEVRAILEVYREVAAPRA